VGNQDYLKDGLSLNIDSNIKENISLFAGDIDQTLDKIKDQDTTRQEITKTKKDDTKDKEIKLRDIEDIGFVQRIKAKNRSTIVLEGVRLEDLI
jgi:hypothetical protein